MSLRGEGARGKPNREARLTAAEVVLVPVLTLVLLLLDGTAPGDDEDENDPGTMAAAPVRGRALL